MKNFPKSKKKSNAVEMFLLTFLQKYYNMYKNILEVGMLKNKNSVQQWLPFEKVLDNGIIKMKNKEYVKILKVEPINFNLKTILEKESILNSYKIFLKTCNFDIQILIQSSRADLSKHFSNLEKINKSEKENIKKYLKNYIDFIQDFNKKRKSSSKNFYILIKEIPENKKEVLKIEKILCENLNEKYFKIKECLSRCGNIVKQYEEKEEVEKIINSFFNVRKELEII